MNYIYLIIAGVLGYLLGKKTNQPHYFKTKSKSELREIRKSAIEALDKRTEERKEKILEFMRGEAEHGEKLKACNLDQGSSQVTRGDIEKLLDVSDVTANKYLNELESENKIKQVGNTGKNVYYILITQEPI